MFAKSNQKKAFTLTEVVLTLMVIGIACAMTVPGLLNSTMDQEYKTKLKKEYGALNQAMNSVLAENGGSIKGLCSTHGCLNLLSI